MEKKGGGIGLGFDAIRCKPLFTLSHKIGIFSAKFMTEKNCSESLRKINGQIRKTKREESQKKVIKVT